MVVCFDGWGRGISDHTNRWASLHCLPEREGVMTCSLSGLFPADDKPQEELSRRLLLNYKLKKRKKKKPRNKHTLSCREAISVKVRLVLIKTKSPVSLSLILHTVCMCLAWSAQWLSQTLLVHMVYSYRKWCRHFNAVLKLFFRSTPLMCKS